MWEWGGSCLEEPPLYSIRLLQLGASALGSSLLSLLGITAWVMVLLKHTVISGLQYPFRADTLSLANMVS